MRISELGDNLIICHKDDVPLLPPRLSATAVGGTEGILRIFGIDLQDPAAEIQAHYGITLRRYLDRFYLWAPEDNLERRQEILNAFFDSVAIEYEALIDVPRNVENLRILLGDLRSRSATFEGSTMIDFGCGTGLSHKLLSEFGVKLIGVDPCPMMRSVARSKGMVVWSPGELARNPPNSLDGAFASYVFHLLPHTHGLRLLWARLRPGGALVANFHKNQGVEMVTACIQELGGIAEPFEASQSERHGQYIAYLKRPR
jgi:SAM-dependent methyltransferase